MVENRDMRLSRLILGPVDALLIFTVLLVVITLSCS
jgi:hypothetical protein